MLYKHWKKVLLSLTAFFWASCDTTSSADDGSSTPPIDNPDPRSSSATEGTDASSASTTPESSAEAASSADEATASSSSAATPASSDDRNVVSSDARVETYAIDNGLSVKAFHFCIRIEFVEITDTKSQIGVGEKFYCFCFC